MGTVQLRSARGVYGICTVLFGNSSGMGYPLWTPKTSLETSQCWNEKRTRVLRVSLVSNILIRFPDALSGNEAANFIHSLGCWCTCWCLTKCKSLRRCRLQSSYSPNQTKLKKKFPGQLTHACDDSLALWQGEWGLVDTKGLDITIPGQVS